MTDVEHENVGGLRHRRLGSGAHRVDARDAKRLLNLPILRADQCYVNHNVLLQFLGEAIESTGSRKRMPLPR